MKKLFALLLTLAMVLASVSAFAATPVAATELAYKGDLTLMHFSTSEESEGNGGSDYCRSAGNVGGVTTQAHGSAATQESQYESTYQFC